MINCPICQNLSDRIFQKDRYWILECKICHHRYVEITPSKENLYQVYNDDYFFGGSAGYPDYLGEAQILIAHGKRYGSILSKYTSPGTLLDVGCAAGFILKGLQLSGWRGVGLEPNSSMSEYGRTHLGLQIENGCLEQFATNQRFNLVSMIQVIAHFFDLRSALQKAADVTKPDGFWLIETWNRESLVARCLGKYWHEYSPPSVLHWFSPQGLKNLVAQYGFSEVARGEPAKRLSGAHAKSLLEYKIRGTHLSWMLGGFKIIPDNYFYPISIFRLVLGIVQKKLKFWCLGFRPNN